MALEAVPPEANARIFFLKENSLVGLDTTISRTFPFLLASVRGPSTLYETRHATETSLCAMKLCIKDHPYLNPLFMAKAGLIHDVGWFGPLLLADPTQLLLGEELVTSEQIDTFAGEFRTPILLRALCDLHPENSYTELRERLPKEVDSPFYEYEWPRVERTRMRSLKKLHQIVGYLLAEKIIETDNTLSPEEKQRLLGLVLVHDDGKLANRIRASCYDTESGFGILDQRKLDEKQTHIITIDLGEGLPVFTRTITIIPRELLVLREADQLGSLAAAATKTSYDPDEAQDWLRKVAADRRQGTIHFISPTAQQLFDDLYALTTSITTLAEPPAEKDWD